MAEVRSRYGLPVMKAVGLSGPEDLAALDLYQTVADQILVDAKPPKGAALPGGNGLAFDWRLLLGRAWRRPWMLATQGAKQGAGKDQRTRADMARMTPQGSVAAQEAGRFDDRPGLPPQGSPHNPYNETGSPQTGIQFVAGGPVRGCNGRGCNGYGGTR